MPRTPCFSNVDSVVQSISLIHEMSMIHKIKRIRLIFLFFIPSVHCGVLGTIIYTASFFIFFMMHDKKTPVY